MISNGVMMRPAIPLPEDAGLSEAIATMLERRISGLTVVDASGTLIGMLTEGDLLRRAEIGTGERHWSGWRKLLRGPGLNAEEYVHTHSRRVADLMTRGPVT